MLEEWLIVAEGDGRHGQNNNIDLHGAICSLIFRAYVRPGYNVYQSGIKNQWFGKSGGVPPKT